MPTVPEPKTTLRQKIKNGLKQIVNSIGNAMGQAKFGGD